MMISHRLILSLARLLLLGVLACGALTIAGCTGEEPSPDSLDYHLARPHRGEMRATINASGEIQPAQTLNLSFQVAGTVADILVKQGDYVEKGEALARLDTRELQLELRRAEAALAQASASYEQLVAEPTTEEIAQAEAQVDQAEAQLRQTQGDVTPQDVTAARQEIAQASALLERLESGPKATDIETARSSLEAARANLATQRDSLSAEKTRAQLQMEQAANTLRERQTTYSDIYWENREIEGFDSQNLSQNAREREESALRAVQDAENTLESARVTYETARQAEITGLQAAEADVRSAQANLEKVLQGVDQDEIEGARAQVARAQANLARLQGDQHIGSIESAQANLQNARASLDQLLTPPREVDVASARAQIQEVETTVEQASINLDKTTLTAPIAGTIANVGIEIGTSVAASAGTPAIVLVDLSRFYVYANVDEIDVAQIAVGQPALLTLDALRDTELAGRVERIDLLSDEASTVASYEVRIETTPDDERVRSGMSVNVDIVVSQKENALLVPRRAVSSDQGNHIVSVLTTPALCDAAPAEWPAVPETQPVKVTTGLSNDQFIEILAGDITEESCLRVEGFDARMDIFGGPPPGQQRRR